MRKSACALCGRGRRRRQLEGPMSYYLSATRSAATDIAGVDRSQR